MAENSFILGAKGTISFKGCFDPGICPLVLCFLQEGYESGQK